MEFLSSSGCSSGVLVVLVGSGGFSRGSGDSSGVLVGSGG